MTTATDPRDLLLQEQVPTVMVPRFGEFRPLAKNGRRFLSASDGLWLEVRTDWLHVTWPLTQQSRVAMPYGSLEKKVDFLYSSLPVDLISRFYAEAREVFPSECAAWLIWNTQSRNFSYRPLRSINSGVGHLRYERPMLAENECLVCDIHSHGPIPALFSSEDDRDDRGEVKIAAVIGGLGEGNRLSVRFRLCVAGLNLPLKIDLSKLPFFADFVDEGAFNDEYTQMFG